MTARTAVNCFGATLIGKTIITQPFGDWRGGQAKVLDVNPDPAAKEIVMEVKALRSKEEVGVFGSEKIQIIINEPREFDELRGH